MRKTFVVGKLAGSTSRILLLEGMTSRTAPSLSTLDASRTVPASKGTESPTIH